MLEALTSGGHLRLGDAVLAAREDYTETGAFPELLAIYHLFGDPAVIRKKEIRGVHQITRRDHVEAWIRELRPSKLREGTVKLRAPKPI